MYDVYGLGNALVDMEFQVPDSYLQRQGIAKGHMTLVDELRLDNLEADLDGVHPERMSGGSAANTIMAVQGFGGRTYYSCKVGDDPTGAYFLDDLRRAGVQVNDNAVTPQGRSGRCLVLITPDAERSMNTFLGISAALGEQALNASALEAATYFYVEGYLSSAEQALAAAISGCRAAAAAGVRTAISLSDPSMVEFFGDNLRSMLGNGVHTLFCNEEEALTFTGTDRLDIAVNELVDVAQEVNVTLGRRGSLFATGHHRAEVPGEPVKAQDTNGAGDIYAGAVLYGRCHGMEGPDAARFGNFAAARLVQEFGARLRSLEDYRALRAAF